MRWWSFPLVILLTIATGLEAYASSAERCTDFRSNGQLRQGQAFRVDIGRGLEFRLVTLHGGPTWQISVGPRGTLDDYLWPVSPPFQTAPHTVIGAAYGQTARDSAEFTPRTLPFVLTGAEYRHVRKLVEEARSSGDSRLTAADFRRMGRGRLVFRIT